MSPLEAASRNGDHGIDILAYDEKADVIWAIQCKCYRPDRKLGPRIVRELLGSLQSLPTGARGMIVTTSTFTTGALEEAEKHSVKTINGAEFTALLRVQASRSKGG